MIIEDSAPLRALLGKYYVNQKGEIVDEAIDCALYWMSAFLLWEETASLVEDDKKAMYWVQYIMMASLDGTAAVDKDFPAHKKMIMRKIEDKAGQDAADKFESIIDSILFGYLRQQNSFYAHYEREILNTVADDAYLTSSKHVYKESNPEISSACEICKWRFLFKICLMCAGPVEAYRFGVRILGMRTA